MQTKTVNYAPFSQMAFESSMQFTYNVESIQIVLLNLKFKSSIWLFEKLLVHGIAKQYSADLSIKDICNAVCGYQIPIIKGWTKKSLILYVQVCDRPIGLNKRPSGFSLSHNLSRNGVNDSMSYK